MLLFVAPVNLCCVAEWICRPYPYITLTLTHTQLWNLMPTANSAFSQHFMFLMASLSIDSIFDLELESTSSRVEQINFAYTKTMATSPPSPSPSTTINKNTMQQYNRNVVLHLQHNWTVNLVWRIQPRNEVTSTALYNVHSFSFRIWYIRIILISIFTVIHECPFYIILSSFWWIFAVHVYAMSLHPSASIIDNSNSNTNINSKILNHFWYAKKNIPATNIPIKQTMAFVWCVHALSRTHTLQAKRGQCLWMGICMLIDAEFVIFKWRSCKYWCWVL